MPEEPHVMIAMRIGTGVIATKQGTLRTCKECGEIVQIAATSMPVLNAQPDLEFMCDVCFRDSDDNTEENIQSAIASMTPEQKREVVESLREFLKGK